MGSQERIRRKTYLEQEMASMDIEVMHSDVTCNGERCASRSKSHEAGRSLAH